jgi:hypothetical protein
MITSSTIKPEQKRLDRSIHTVVDQTNIRINLAAETGNRAQFARQMPEQRHHGSKRLDRSAKQRQCGREDVLLGECRVRVKTTRVALEDDTSEADLRLFLAALHEFSRENEIETFVIKTRAKKVSLATRSTGLTNFCLRIIVRMNDDIGAY